MTRGQPSSASTARTGHGRRGPLLAAGLLFALGSAPITAQQEGVASTVHNLSVSGPGEIRSTLETEVCKFCHIPHSVVVPEALWGHQLSEANYTTPELQRGRPGQRAAPQPDGSSRLCLSCHDGTVALGDVAGRKEKIEMRGQQRLAAGDRGFLGVDLTGSHPISFEIKDEKAEEGASTGDIGVRPLAVIRESRSVRLDGENKLQCTSCHDPHSDRFFQEGRTPRFWVAPTVNEVCETCHALR